MFRKLRKLSLLTELMNNLATWFDWSMALIHPEKVSMIPKKFLWIKEKFLWFKEISWLFFFIEFKRLMSVQSHKYMRNVINRNMFFNLMKKWTSFKVIKLNKLFLMFFPVLYLNQMNIFFNQINNVLKNLYSSVNNYNFWKFFSIFEKWIHV